MPQKRNFQLEELLSTVFQRRGDMVIIRCLTTVERDTINTPTQGLLIYNTTTGALNLYTGVSWVAL